METAYEPLTKREREELASYVGWFPVVARAVLFLVAVAAAAGLGAVIFGALSRLSWFFDGPGWWVASGLAFAVWLYRRSKRWTGGRELAAAIRRDLERGEAAVHRIEVQEAVLLEEREDEGPTVFVRGRAGEVVRFSGQELDRPVRKGFPWAVIEVRETPVAKRFLGLGGEKGQPVEPLRRGPPSREEEAAWGPFDSEWAVVDADFAEIARTAGPAE